MHTPEEIAKELGQASKRGYGWMCKCPLHDDDKASLSVHEQDGIIRFKCFAECKEKNIAKHLGYDKQELPTVVYNYCDESGNVLFHKTRKGKEFRCVGANGETNLRGIRKVLYNTQLLNSDELVVIVEGEKDADICVEHGFCAVCNFDGAGKWLAEYSEQLRGKHTVILPDYDQPGLEHAELVRDKLEGIAASTDIVDIRALFGEIGIERPWKGADIHDWFLRGGTRDRLRQVITATQTLSDAPDMAFIMREALTLIDERTRRDKAYSGLETGFRELDKLTDGFQPADLVVLAARPSVGKTALAMNIAENVLERHGNVVFFSMEMGGKYLAARLLRSMTHIDNRARELTEGDWRALEDAASRVLNSGLIIDDTSPLTITKLQKRARFYHRAKPIDLILVDYVQYMKGEGESTREREVAAVSEGLKTLAKELDCPVLALAQLNRAVEQRANGRPQLSDLRDSGAIEQDADVVMLMWNDKNMNVKNIELAKHRNGPVGEFQLIFDAGQTRFINKEEPKPKAQPQVEGLIESEEFLI